MRVLVAGGGGFIGSHLVDKLVGCGDYVVVADNLCLGKFDHFEHHLGKKNFSFYHIDISENDKLFEVFKKHKFDRIYHLAANSDIQKGAKNPNIDIHDTLNTTLSILLAMKEYNIKQLMFASTSAVYGDKKELLTERTGDLKPVSYYGGAKLASEAFISSFAEMCDMSVNILRFPNVVGERLTHGVIYDFIAKLKRNSEVLEILGDGKQEKPYIYVQDLIEAMCSLQFSDVGVNVFNAGVASTTTVEKIADIVCGEMGLAGVKYVFSGGSVGWKGDIAKFQYDLSKIHSTGWFAKHTSDEAVRLAVKAALI